MNEELKSLYPDIFNYSKATGRSIPLLVKAFEIESNYHKKILEENDRIKREALYEEFYSKLLNVYERNAEIEKGIDVRIQAKDPQARMFQRELLGKSIIDFGCGEGCFLMNLQRNLSYESLAGVDVYIPDKLKEHDGIDFISSSITNFKTSKKYDVAFSDNVIEHLAPDDVKDHLKVVYDSLKPGGNFILIMPNRLFGPSDITRIIDDSSSGRIAAKGGHLYESTYGEMMRNLTEAGFNNFQTVLPIPKLKYSLLKNIRISPRWIFNIEESPFWLSMFRSLKSKGKCIIRFSITLKCQKPLNN